MILYVCRQTVFLASPVFDKIQEVQTRGLQELESHYQEDCFLMIGAV